MKSSDDGRRLALQLHGHHGILLRGPVFSIFWCFAQWRKVESYCFVHMFFFFFHGGGNVTVDEVGCR